MICTDTNRHAPSCPPCPPEAQRAFAAVALALCSRLPVVQQACQLCGQSPAAQCGCQLQCRNNHCCLKGTLLYEKVPLIFS